MGLFEQLPYANFHELNLDWLLQVVKEIAKKADITDQEVEAKVTEIMNQLIADGFFDEFFDKRLLVIDTMTQIPAGLAVGTAVQTKGWRSIGDGGDGLYIVTSTGFPTYGAYNFYILHETRVDVRQCGIFGNDYATNRDRLQRALNTYGYIDLAPGETYQLNNPLTVSDNQHIDGHGATFTIGVNDAFSVINRAGTGVKNVVIENLTVVGSGSPSALYYLTSFGDSENIAIRNCKFSKSYGYAVRVSGSRNVTIENCNFEYLNGASSNPGGCIYMQGGEGLIVQNVRADYIQDHVVYLDGSTPVSRVRVDNSRCSNITNPLTNAAMIACYGQVSQCVFTNNYIQNGVIGFQCSERGGTSPRIITFNRCTAVQMTQEGFYIDSIPGTYTDAYIDLIDCRCSNSVQDALAIRNVSFVNINNLQCDNYGRNGLALSNSSYCNVINSRFSNGETAIICGYPVTTGTDNNTFLNCETDNNTQYGIYNRAGINRYINCRTSTDVRQIGTGVDVLGGNARSVIYRANSPENTTNYYTAGDICIDNSGATNGWRCTASGAPGTWVPR